ncbi:PfkB family carbohydrate kinase [Nocardioides sp.]|uniref:PfkB family carbohydrate kinase n=1 Tax=Nocardioides sp. TaxID=35761 RepID=UPI003514B098
MDAPADQPPAVLVVGEALVDVVRSAEGAEGKEVAHPGGSPLNVAIGLARLGVPALLHTHLAEDDDGRVVLAHLAANDVPLTPTSLEPGGTTSRAVATIGADGAATYDFAITWAPAPLPAGLAAASRALHLGSISAYLSPGARVVDDAVAAAAAADVPVSFDPNVRPALLGPAAEAWARVLDLARHCTIVKLSDEDADFLQPGRDPLDVLDELRGLGPALAVLTRGGEGLAGLVAGAAVEVSGAVVTVADTIGAGDTISAALLARVLTHGVPADAAALRVVLEAAAEAAGVTVSRPGADPPRLAELGPAWH